MRGVRNIALSNGRQLSGARSLEFPTSRFAPLHHTGSIRIITPGKSVIGDIILLISHFNKSDRLDGVVGYHVRLTFPVKLRERSRVRASLESLIFDVCIFIF